MQSAAQLSRFTRGKRNPPLTLANVGGKISFPAERGGESMFFFLYGETSFFPFPYLTVDEDVDFDDFAFRAGRRPARVSPAVSNRRLLHQKTRGKARRLKMPRRLDQLEMR